LQIAVQFYVYFTIILFGFEHFRKTKVMESNLSF